METLAKAHPNFKGNRDDLKAFIALVQSPIRSRERGEALKAWATYKLNRQKQELMAQYQSSTSGSTSDLNANPLLDSTPIVHTKIGHIKSLSFKAIDLRGANLDGITLGYADMRAVILDGASMRGAWMKGVQFQDSSLKNVDFSPDEYGRTSLLTEGNFNFCDLNGAVLREADLTDATFKQTDLRHADLSSSNLSNTIFNSSDIRSATLTNCRIHGIAAWDLKKTGAIQKDLLITQNDDLISVDDLEIAQFVYLLLNNKNITNVISTIGQRAVLILGRFTPDRKRVLDAVREKLRSDYNLIPIVFDFERAAEKTVTETVQVLAGLSRFVIADITRPKSSPLELQATIPNFQIPFVTIIQEGEDPFSMFTDLWKQYNDRVLRPLAYPNLESLLQNFQTSIMDEVLKVEKELEETKLVDSISTRKMPDVLKPATQG